MEPSHNSQLFELPASQPSSCFLTSRSDACLCLCLLCSVDLKGFWNSSHGNDHVHPLEWILLMLGSSSSAAHSRSFFGNPLLYYTWDYKDVEVALICVVAMLGIIYDKRLYWKEKAFLVFPAFTTAFLVHIQEAGLFLIIFLPVYLVTSKDGLAAKISILLSFVGSLLFAILVNTLVSIP